FPSLAFNGYSARPRYDTFHRWQTRARFEGELERPTCFRKRDCVMKMFNKLGRGWKLAIVLPALAALAACASPFRADVARFQSQLPAPAGQTFTVVADDPAMAGGIEFRNY